MSATLLVIIIVVMSLVMLGNSKSKLPTRQTRRKSQPDSDEVLLFTFRTNKTAYLKSPEWEKQRLQTLFKANYMCQSCGSADPLQVHHLRDYDRLGKERPNSLVALCGPCHEHQHSVLGYPQTYKDYMNWDVQLIIKENTHD